MRNVFERQNLHNDRDKLNNMLLHELWHTNVYIFLLPCRNRHTMYRCNLSQNSGNKDRTLRYFQFNYEQFLEQLVLRTLFEVELFLFLISNQISFIENELFQL